jgi:hypothetical protein
VLEPVAFPAADHIHADDATVWGQRCREDIKVPAVSREAVHAYDQVRITWIAPLCARDLVKAVRPEAPESL